MKKQLWSSWEEFLDTNKSDNEKISEKPVIEETYVKKFGYKDRSVYGTYPSWNSFHLVRCELCTKVIKHQYLKGHMERKHNNLDVNVLKQAKSVRKIDFSESSWIIDMKSERKGLKILLTRQSGKNNYYNCQIKVEQNNTSSPSLTKEETKSNIEFNIGSGLQQKIAAQSPSLPSYESMPPICSNQEISMIEHLSKMKKSKQYSILKDNQTVSSVVKSDVCETYSRPSSVSAFKMKKDELVFCANSDSVGQTYIKAVSPRKRMYEKSSPINGVVFPQSVSSTSDSSTNDTMKSRPFLMPKYSDIYCQPNSHVTYPNKQFLLNEEHLTTFENLNNNISEENQCITKSLLNAQVHQKLNDIYQWEPLQHNANLKFKDSYPLWEPPTDYSCDTGSPQSTDAEKISFHALNSHLAKRFDELQSQLLISKAAIGT